MKKPIPAGASPMWLAIFNQRDTQVTEKTHSFLWRYVFTDWKRMTVS